MNTPKHKAIAAFAAITLVSTSGAMSCGDAKLATTDPALSGDHVMVESAVPAGAAPGSADESEKKQPTKEEIAACKELAGYVTIYESLLTQKRLTHSEQSGTVPAGVAGWAVILGDWQLAKDLWTNPNAAVAVEHSQHDAKLAAAEKALSEWPWKKTGSIDWSARLAEILPEGAQSENQEEALESFSEDLRNDQIHALTKVLNAALAVMSAKDVTVGSNGKSEGNSGEQTDGTRALIITNLAPDRLMKLKESLEDLTRSLPGELESLRSVEAKAVELDGLAINYTREWGLVNNPPAEQLGDEDASFEGSGPARGETGAPESNGALQTAWSKLQTAMSEFTTDDYSRIVPFGGGWGQESDTLLQQFDPYMEKLDNPAQETPGLLDSTSELAWRTHTAVKNAETLQRTVARRLEIVSSKGYLPEAGEESQAACKKAREALKELEDALGEATKAEVKLLQGYSRSDRSDETESPTDEEKLKQFSRDVALAEREWSEAEAERLKAFDLAWAAHDAVLGSNAVVASQIKEWASEKGTVALWNRLSESREFPPQRRTTQPFSPKKPDLPELVHRSQDAENALQKVVAPPSKNIALLQVQGQWMVDSAKARASKTIAIVIKLQAEVFKSNEGPDLVDLNKLAYAIRLTDTRIEELGAMEGGYEAAQGLRSKFEDSRGKVIQRIAGAVGALRLKEPFPEMPSAFSEAQGKLVVHREGSPSGLQLPTELAGWDRRLEDANDSNQVEWSKPKSQSVWEVLFPRQARPAEYTKHQLVQLADEYWARGIGTSIKKEELTDRQHWSWQRRRALQIQLDASGANGDWLEDSKERIKVLAGADKGVDDQLTSLRSLVDKRFGTPDTRGESVLANSNARVGLVQAQDRVAQAFAQALEKAGDESASTDIKGIRSRMEEGLEAWSAPAWRSPGNDTILMRDDVASDGRVGWRSRLHLDALEGSPGEEGFIEAQVSRAFTAEGEPFGDGDGTVKTKISTLGKSIQSESDKIANAYQDVYSLRRKILAARSLIHLEDKEVAEFDQILERLTQLERDYKPYETFEEFGYALRSALDLSEMDPIDLEKFQNEGRPKSDLLKLVQAHREDINRLAKSDTKVEYSLGVTGEVQGSCMAPDNCDSCKLDSDIKTAETRLLQILSDRMITQAVDKDKKAILDKLLPTRAASGNDDNTTGGGQ